MGLIGYHRTCQCEMCRDEPKASRAQQSAFERRLLREWEHECSQQGDMVRFDSLDHPLPYTFFLATIP